MRECDDCGKPVALLDEKPGSTVKCSSCSTFGFPTRYIGGVSP